MQNNPQNSSRAGVLPWKTPALGDYEALLAESEFGAWVLVNGYGLSHSTVSVHRLGLECALAYWQYILRLKIVVWSSGERFWAEPKHRLCSSPGPRVSV